MKILTLLLCILVVSCSFSGQEKQLRNMLESMDWLYDADPTVDALEAISRNDLRFRGIYGAKLYIPRVPNECFSGWEETKKTVIPIEGTSNTVWGYEHARLIAIAREYAKWYNFQILVHLRENGLWDCDL